MSISHADAKLGFSPLRPETRSSVWQVGAVLIGTVVLALASRIEVPIYPAPMTLQTLPVTIIGALYGWRLGGITILAWLGEALIGLPVLGGAESASVYFAGLEAGYIFAFPIIGALMGWLAERGWNGGNVILAFTGMLGCNILFLALGATWIAANIGTENAIAFGVMPFLIGAVLKSAIGAAALRVLPRAKSVTE